MIFSLVIYKSIDKELQRIQHFQQSRQERLESFHFPPQGTPIPRFDPKEISDSRDRLIINLILINLGILVLSGIAGYFLAGRTLKPIKIMLDEQNRFITDASHELKTPLTALRTEIEVYFLNKNRVLKDADSIIKSNLEEAINLQRLSESLIRLTKFENTNKTLLTQLSLLSTIEDALKKVIPFAKKKNIVVDNKVGEEKIWGEKQSLTELFVILIDNAIKYSPEKTKIIIDSIRADNHVSIKIKDQGIGIGEKEIPHIFDRFFRADKSRTRNEASGHGLGLSIAKKIVEAHKGIISVESKVGKGAIFSVQLPIS